MRKITASRRLARSAMVVTGLLAASLQFASPATALNPSGPGSPVNWCAWLGKGNEIIYNKYAGRDTWVDESLKSQGIVVKVQYLWCPRYPSGDSAGINWARGIIERTWGTWQVTYGQGYSYAVDGASLHLNGCYPCNRPPEYWGDAEGTVTRTLNSSSNRVTVVDESTFGPGNQEYKYNVQFWVRVYNPDTHVSRVLGAMSPTF